MAAALHHLINSRPLRHHIGEASQRQFKNLSVVRVFAACAAQFRSMPVTKTPCPSQISF